MSRSLSSTAGSLDPIRFDPSFAKWGVSTGWVMKTFLETPILILSSWKGLCRVCQCSVCMLGCHRLLRETCRPVVWGSPPGGWGALTQLACLGEKLCLLDCWKLYLFCLSPLTKLNACCAIGNVCTSVYGFSYIPWVSQQVVLHFILLCKCYFCHTHTHIHKKHASSVTKLVMQCSTLLECVLLLWWWIWYWVGLHCMFFWVVLISKILEL